MTFYQWLNLNEKKKHNHKLTRYTFWLNRIHIFYTYLPDYLLDGHGVTVHFNREYKMKNYFIPPKSWWRLFFSWCWLIDYYVQEKIETIEQMCRLLCRSEEGTKISMLKPKPKSLNLTKMKKMKKKKDGRWSIISKRDRSFHILYLNCVTGTF